MYNNLNLKKHLKRISISTDKLLLDSNYDIIPEMYEFLKAIKDKYRIYMLT